MREATIDLDWLDGEIEKTKLVLKSVVADDYGILTSMYNERIGSLQNIRSKCIPIEEPKEIFLSKTCTNNWEDKKFCENTGKCELCKIKQ